MRHRARVRPRHLGDVEATGFLHDAGFADVLLTASSPRPKRHGQLALLLGRAPG